MLAKRIQGKRWAVIVFDGPDSLNIIDAPVLARFELWAMAVARDLPCATVVDVDAAEATRMARGGAYVDDTTLAELAELSGNSKPFMRKMLRQHIAKGKGMLAKRMRAELSMPKRKQISDPAPPAGTAELLCSALSRVLGDDAEELKARPRDWKAVRAYAHTVIGEGR